MPENARPSGSGGLLDVIERIGNRLPDPSTLFLLGTIAVILLSALAVAGDWTVQPKLPRPVMESVTATDGTVEERPVASNATAIIIRGIDLKADPTSPTDQHDTITVDAGSGHDRLIAGLVPEDDSVLAYQVLSARATDGLQLLGGADDDRIVGTFMSEEIRFGTGADIVTGNGGVDVFKEDVTEVNGVEISNVSDAFADTLIEARDADFSLTRTDFAGTLRETLLTEGTDVSDEPFSEFEIVDLLETFRLIGGADENFFSVSNFVREAYLDGSESGDTFEIELSGPLAGASNVFVSDTGTVGSDTAILKGGDTADTLHLDDDTTIQRIWLADETSNPGFKLTYGGEETDVILGTGSAGAAQILQKLAALSTIGSQNALTVDGDGSELAPWIVKFADGANGAGVARNVEQKLFRIGVYVNPTTSEDYRDVVSTNANRATVTRLDASIATALVDGKPAVDDLFGPGNETQVLNAVEGATGTFRLRYDGGSYTTALAADASKADVENALAGIGLQTRVTGDGTARNPWRIKIETATKDSKGNFFLFEVHPDDASVVTAPKDAADAAAETRASIFLNTQTSFQRVYYDLSAENIVIRGAGGADTFVADDSMAPLTVYGDEGADNFLIGRVLKTTIATVGGQQVEIIDGADGVTAGVRFNAMFFGGRGNDYFEVNHNIGTLQLFGGANNDLFFLKAQLTNDPAEGDGTANKLGGEKITAGAGTLDGEKEAGERDTLINYLQNNRVEIFGGSGFDTLVVAGTSLDDDFYLFADNEGRQFVYGAGLKLEGVQGVERLALVTGAGDDTVYLYSLDKSLTLLLNLGSGSDEIIVGGGDVDFDVVYPAASEVYNVEQQVVRDQPTFSRTITNDVVFRRHDWAEDSELIKAAWKQFYAEWLNTDDDVVIDRTHWRLLEANMAVAMKLFAQGVDKARLSPIRGTYLWPTEWTRDGILEWIDLVNETNRLEQLLLDANATGNVRSGESGNEAWRNMVASERLFGIYGGFLASIFSSARFRDTGLKLALDLDQAPKLPDSVPFETFDALVGNGLRAGARPLDKVLYQEYLRPTVALTIWGDFFRGEQIRLGTGLNSPRIANWGYEPDFYLSDLIYRSQVLVGSPFGGSWLPHIQGAEQVWTDGSLYSQDGVGTRMFWDLISLFYEIETPRNGTARSANPDPINLEQNFVGVTETGVAAYRFDNLPQRTVTKTLHANYDLSKIAAWCGSPAARARTRSRSTAAPRKSSRWRRGSCGSPTTPTARAPRTSRSCRPGSPSWTCRTP